MCFKLLICFLLYVTWPCGCHIQSIATKIGDLYVCILRPKVSLDRNLIQYTRLRVACLIGL